MSAMVTRTATSTNSQFSVELLEELAINLSENSRYRLRDVNTAFYETFIKTLLGNIDDAFISDESENVFYLLKKFGPYFSVIHLDHQSDIGMEETFPYCPEILNITSYDCEVNELVDLIYNHYQDCLTELTLGYHSTGSRPLLSQLPNLPHLKIVKLFNTTIVSQLISELFYFLPETLEELGLSFIDTIDDELIKFFYSNHPKVNSLELHGEVNDQGLLALNTFNSELKILALSNLKLSRPNPNFTLKPSRLPNLDIFYMKGYSGAEDSSKVPKLLSAQEYDFTMLMLQNMNMTVSYTFNSSRFPNLTYLSLQSCAMITADAFTQIFTCLPSLITLNLHNADVERDSIVGVLKTDKKIMSPVKYLSMKNIALDLLFLTFLNRLPLIRYLDLSDTLDTDLDENSGYNSEEEKTFPFEVFLSKKSLQHLHTLRIRGSFVDENTLLLILKVAAKLDMVELDDEHRSMIEDNYPNRYKGISFVDEIEFEPEIFEIESILDSYK